MGRLIGSYTGHVYAVDLPNAAAATPSAAAAVAKNQYLKTPNHPSISSTATIWFFNKSDNELSSALYF